MNIMLFSVIKKFKKLLSKRQKIKIFGLGLMMILGGLLEMLSVSLMIPFMNAVIDTDKFMMNKYVKYVSSSFGIKDTKQFLTSFAIMLALVFIFKNLYLLFQTNVQNHFIYGNMFDTQKRLLNSFLNRPYEYFLAAKSGEILRIVGEDTMETFKCLSNLISIFTETIVAFILLVTMLIVSPIITLGIAGILCITMFGILILVRPRMSAAGLALQVGASGMRKWLLQSIQGIKEVKVSRKEAFFSKKYNEYGKGYINAILTSTIFGTIPRYAIETICLSSFFLIVASLIYHGQAVDTMIPIISAVAMTALRLIPAVNRVSASLAAISYQEPMLNKMLENLCLIDSNNSGIMESKEEVGRIKGFNEGFGFKNLTYSYPGNDVTVLDNSNLMISKGESIGIVGPSGAGKTTTVDILMGLLNPTSGCVFIDGIDIKTDMEGWLRQIGYIPQLIFLLDDTIRANIAFGISDEDIDDAAVWRALEEAALADFVRELPDGLDTNVGERGIRLSGGQRQRIGIARALYTNPSILFFDEATSALDNETEKAIMESINHLHGNKTIIIIAHRLSTIEACDIVYRVEEGKIIEEKVKKND